MFFGLGSTPSRIRNRNPSTVRRVKLSLIVLPLDAIPNVLWASSGAPPICLHRLKNSSADKVDGSVYRCIRIGSCRVYACSAPARYEIRIVGASTNGPWDSKKSVCWVWPEAGTCGSGRFLLSIFSCDPARLSSVVVKDPIGYDALFVM